ncbi:E2-like enzyme [Rhizina undulata]
MNRLTSTISSWREYLTPATHTSTFTATGQLTPEEFVAAGDYLVYKFPTWSWQGAPAGKCVAYLPEDKQYLLLRHAPCHSRLDDEFSTWNPGEDDEGEDGWAEGKVRGEKVKSVDDAGKEEEESDGEAEIPDMEDEEDDDEAIIKEVKGKGKAAAKGKAPFRTYNLQLTYSTYYRTPRFYLSGHEASLPLSPPTLMFEDIAPDYREKTVTIEEFPFMENGVQMASVHPCRHAEMMKRIFESMTKRKARQRGEEEKREEKKSEKGDEWEEVVAGEMECEAEEDGLRVDQYLVVFLKFMAGVVPGVEMDYTMGI